MSSRATRVRKYCKSGVTDARAGKTAVKISTGSLATKDPGFSDPHLRNPAGWHCRSVRHLDHGLLEATGATFGFSDNFATPSPPSLDLLAEVRLVFGLRGDKRKCGSGPLGVGDGWNPGYRPDFRKRLATLTPRNLGHRHGFFRCERSLFAAQEWTVGIFGRGSLCHRGWGWFAWRGSDWFRSFGGGRRLGWGFAGFFTPSRRDGALAAHPGSSSGFSYWSLFAGLEPAGSGAHPAIVVEMQRTGNVNRPCERSVFLSFVDACPESSAMGTEMHFWRTSWQAENCPSPQNDDRHQMSLPLAAELEGGSTAREGPLKAMGLQQ